MTYTIDPNSATPAYLQLYYAIRADIIGGVYPCNARLPSKRLLAEESGVSVITAEHAYAILAEEGYIEPRRRSGYFVIYRSDDFSAAASLPMSTPTGSAPERRAGEFPFSVLAKTMRRVLTDYGERILIKSPNHGCLELRQAIAAYLARMGGLKVRPEQIVVGAGAEYLYSLIAQLLGKSHTFALESPSYEKIRRVYAACGLDVELLPMGADGILSSALERSRATVLHTTPFHSFPTGVTADASKRREYLRWVRTRNGFLIEDNFDSELTVSRKAEEPLFGSAPDIVLYLNTFSHTIAPSLRMGYLVLPEGLCAPFEEMLGFYSCTVPMFEQFVLAELLNSGDFERHINRVRRARRKGGDLVI
ncbi:MAG: PLP-dependent aminotransferase family protein [Clostridia bacterium]|nr:PLP-dependent aminotransferase family protein [Clostridia bacterium]